MQARITHVQPTTGSSTCEVGKKTCTQFFVKTSFDLIMQCRRLEAMKIFSEATNYILHFQKFCITRMFYVCFSPAFRLLLADPDPGPRDLDSCNPILLLKLICILSHKKSVGRFILQIGASFCGVQQHFETKVVDR